MADYVKEEAFCFTYGDGVADIDISALIAFTAAMAARRRSPRCSPGRYGALRREGDRVTGFTEKPRGDGGLINGGFFVLSPSVLSLIESDDTSWEAAPLEALSRDGQFSRL